MGIRPEYATPEHAGLPVPRPGAAAARGIQDTGRVRGQQACHEVGQRGGGPVGAGGGAVLQFPLGEYVEGGLGALLPYAVDQCPYDGRVGCREGGGLGQWAWDRQSAGGEPPAPVRELLDHSDDAFVQALLRVVREEENLHLPHDAVVGRWSRHARSALAWGRYAIARAERDALARPLSARRTLLFPEGRHLMDRLLRHRDRVQVRRLEGHVGRDLDETADALAGLSLRRATGRVSPFAARKEEARIPRSLGSGDRPFSAAA